MTTLFELRADQENKDALREAHKCGDKRKMGEILHNLGFSDHRIVYSDVDQIFIAPLSYLWKQPCNKYKRAYRTITNRNGTTHSVAALQFSK